MPITPRCNVGGNALQSHWRIMGGMLCSQRDVLWPGSAFSNSPAIPARDLLLTACWLAAWSAIAVSITGAVATTWRGLSVSFDDRVNDMCYIGSSEWMNG